MIQIIFDQPPRVGDTAVWDVPQSVVRWTTENAPVGKMFGYVEDATGWEIYDPANYIPVDTRPEIVVTSVLGVGAINFDGSSEAICRVDKSVTITATNSGPDGVWTTPVKAPSHVKYADTSKDSAVDPNLMSIDVTFDEAGDWYVTEDLINRDLPESLNFKFDGLHIKVVL